MRQLLTKVHSGTPRQADVVIVRRHGEREIRNHKTLNVAVPALGDVAV